MNYRFVAAAAALGLAAVLTINPSFAQKAKDTLRFPISDMEAGIDTYVLPGDFANIWGPSVYDYLLDFDPREGAFIPHIAKSWAQPDPLTYEFELRDDVKWHDGQALDADDVVYTLSYLIDPKVNLRYKTRWAWIKSVEKLSAYKVRVTATQPVPYGLMWMASHTPIYPKHAHEAYTNKIDFATHPIGTGPLRIVQMDKNTGIVGEKFAGYLANAVKAGSGVGRIVAEPVKDAGSLTALLLTGAADVAAGLPSDQADALRQSGRFDLSLGPPNLGYSFIGFPSKGAANAQALGDVRVRTAILKAIDRKALDVVKWGDLATGVRPVEALCNKEQIGCGYTKLVPAYDPAGAKKLLAEAGYGAGFDVTISCFPSGVPDATAISGMLRAVGIRATVQSHPIAQRVQLINQGKVEIGYYAWSGGGVFEVSDAIERHIAEYDDPMLEKLAAPTRTILNDAERRTAAAKVFDHITENAYAAVLIPATTIYTHTKEVKLTATTPREFLVSPHEFGWN
jgi:peptide/nickel transport system substrate-binding protein